MHAVTASRQPLPVLLSPYLMHILTFAADGLGFGSVSGNGNVLIAHSGDQVIAGPPRLLN